MGIFPGGAAIKEVYAGAPIKEVYAGSQLVWSAFKPSYGVVYGPQGGSETSRWNRVPYNTWTPFPATTSGTAGVPYPHPDYPNVAATDNGVNVVAGTYLFSGWSETAGPYAEQRGIRATLDGAPIPGLSVLQTYEGGNLPITISGVVTIGPGNVNLEGWITSAGGYLYTGGDAVTGFTLVPFTP